MKSIQEYANKVKRRHELFAAKYHTQIDSLKARQQELSSATEVDVVLELLEGRTNTEIMAKIALHEQSGVLYSKYGDAIGILTRRMVESYRPHQKLLSKIQSNYHALTRSKAEINVQSAQAGVNVNPVEIRTAQSTYNALSRDLDLCSDGDEELIRIQKIILKEQLPRFNTRKAA